MRQIHLPRCGSLQRFPRLLAGFGEKGKDSEMERRERAMEGNERRKETGGGWKGKNNPPRRKLLATALGLTLTVTRSRDLKFAQI